jgi:hypothetical protein
MKVQVLIRKIRYAIFVRKGLTRKPAKTESVISDLFLIRATELWRTYFEILNIPGLLNGHFSVGNTQKLHFIFFDSEGTEIGRKLISAPRNAKQSLALDQDFFQAIDRASTFSVFHTDFKINLDLSGSYLTERGYTGFQRNDVPIKGYVHGNLDAIAFSDGSTEMLGNSGIFRRSYQIQHPFTGPSHYEVFLVNSSDKKLRIRVEFREASKRWRSYESFTLHPRGSRQIEISIGPDEIKFIRIVSKLYLGRPVVFRNTNDSFDVFHG